jgi:hypothetical protein
MHPQTGLPMLRTLDATATGNTQTDASGFRKFSPSETSMTL